MRAILGKTVATDQIRLPDGRLQLSYGKAGPEQLRGVAPERGWPERKEAAMAKQVREYVSELTQLAAIRAFIEEECRRGWGAARSGGGTHPATAVETALDQLLLAVQETASNIVRHGYHDEASRPIRVVLEVSADEVRLFFHYPGRDFDPEQVPPPAFDGTREGGFGIYLIRQLVDEVHYHRDSTGLCSVHLRKKRSPAVPQEAHSCS